MLALLTAAGAISIYCALQQLLGSLAPPALIQALVLDMIAVVASFAAAVIAASKLAPDPFFCRQLAFRAGILAPTLASGFLLSFLVVNVLNATDSAQDILGRQLAWRAFFNSVACILPTVPFAFLGSSIGSRLFAKPQPLPTADAPSLKPDPFRWIEKVTWLIAAVGILAPFSLSSIPVRRDPPPSPKIEPTASQTPKPPTPAFRYSWPSDLTTTGAERLSIIARKTLAKPDQTAPMLFSDDAKLLAYCPAESGRQGKVLIHAVESDELLTSFLLNRKPAALAWSPDSKSLFYVLAGQPKQIGVLALTGKVTPLPRPKNGDIPNAQFLKWFAREVIFYTEDEGVVSLNLDDLLLRPLKDVASFQADAHGDRGKLEAKPSFPLASTGAWKLQPAMRITTTAPPPRRQPDGDWRIEGRYELVFADAKRPLLNFLSAVQLKRGDLLISAPDHAKVVIASDDKTEILYLAISQAHPLAYTLTSPFGAEQAPALEAFKAAVIEKRVHAFIYAPLINPLTGATVGANRQHVKAMLQSLDWQDDKPVFWLSQMYATISAEDVAADLHTWEDGDLKPVQRGLAAEWWARPLAMDAANQPQLPKPAEVKAADFGTEGATKSANWGIEFEGGVRRSPVPPPKKLEPPQVDPATAPLAKPTPQPPPRDEVNEVHRFVREHHRKASAGDLEGYLSDYAQTVTFMGKTKTLDELRQDEIAYRNRWTKTEEDFLNHPVVQKRGDGFDVSYTLLFRTENPSEGWWQMGRNALRLFIVPVGSAFKIVRQDAQISDRREGRLDAAVPLAAQAAAARQPPVPITVARPCWIGSFRLRSTANVEVHDQLHFEEGSAVMHRTYLLLKDGAAVNSFRAEFTATVQRLRNSATVNFTGHKWDRDPGSGSFADLIKANANSISGGLIEYQIRGDTLLEPTDGIVLKPVQ